MSFIEKWANPYSPEEEKIRNEKTREASDDELVKGGADSHYVSVGKREIAATPEQIEKARQEMDRNKEWRNSEEKRKEIQSFISGLGYVTEFTEGYGTSYDSKGIAHTRYNKGKLIDVTPTDRLIIYEKSPTRFRPNKKNAIATIDFTAGRLEAERQVNMAKTMALADQIRQKFQINFNEVNYVDSPENMAEIHDEERRFL